MVIRKIVLFIFFLCNVLIAEAQYGDCVNYDERYPRTTTNPPRTYYWWEEWNFTDLSQRRVSNLHIGDDMFNGLLEYLPAGYNHNDKSKLYPVIIYFHGYGSRGFGSATELCRLFKDRGGDSLTHLSVPGRVERNPGLFTQTIGVKQFKYIVISPQFNIYNRLTENGTDRFPSGKQIEDVINYVVANYNVDPRGIFLTGLSNGANMITEYAASSVERAQRIAGLMPVALCSDLDHESNTGMGINAAFIGQAKLKTWFVYCEQDNCGKSGYDGDESVHWVNAIKAVPGHAPPRFTILKNLSPPTLYHCSDTLWHDAWSRAYNPDFKESFVNGTGASDGIKMNMYEWFTDIYNSNIVLPVTLKSYTARKTGDRVELRWITSDEKNNLAFVIERAGDGQTFTKIGELPGAGNSQSDKEYIFYDNNPLEGLNYYRIVQNDIDGVQKYFEIKKILNNAGKSAVVIVTPNPAPGNISAFISLRKSQKVTAILSDINGRIIENITAFYGEGSSELKLPGASLTAGLYLLKVMGEDFSSTTKIIRR